MHNNDLIAATHGRAFWVIDDISILRRMADSVTAHRAFLFQPDTAVRWFSGGGRSLTAGQNPPGGAYIDYWLRAEPTDPITLQFLDGAGKVIRVYTSEHADSDSVKTATDSLSQKARQAQKDSLAYQPADSVMSARAGTNRFVWNLQYPGAKRLKNTVVDEGTLDGPVAPPGSYSARLIVGTDTMSRPFTVIADPRVKTSRADLVAQFDAAIRARDRITGVVDAAQRIEDFQSQIDDRTARTKDQPYAKRVSDAATPLRRKFEAIRAELYEVGATWTSARWTSR